jgi:hypothetical protein
MPLILPSNSISAGGYEVANSLRFDDGSSDNLSRTFGTPSSGTTWTISFWVKKSTNGSALNLCSRLVDGSNEDRIRFTSGDALEWSVYKSGSYAGRLVTNRLFRDNSAWYNIICVWDTTNGTAGDRMRMYVNGVEETSFSTDTNPSLNETSNFNASGSNHRIGSVTSGEYFDGYMAEVVMIDGTAVSDATSFGEFDEDTGIWKPISVSGLTFGTNGFYLDFENSGSLGADVSGNGNNFTVNNLTSIDQTTDTPTNNYATGNVLIPSTLTYSDGNLTIQRTTTNWESTGSTIAVTQGKWYAEFKWISGTFAMIGVEDMELVSTWDNEFMGQTANGRGYGWDGNVRNNGSSSSYGASYSTGDIIGVALDMDNKFVYMSKNGTFQNSGDPTSGATGTGGLSLSGTEYIIGWSAYNSVISANFGNPPFTISSGNSDGNGYGNFEYSVPENYYSLNVKNLAEFG